VRVDWIMDNLYFNYDIFNLNEQVAKETELCSFLTSYALLFYAQNSSVKSKNYTDWIEEKFIQHNKSPMDVYQESIKLNQEKAKAS
jgi:hypothetical protein